MTLQDLNIKLNKLAGQPGREQLLEFTFALIEWMGLAPNKDNKPQLLTPQTQKLKDFLAPAPITSQAQLYRLTADGQSIRVRFAVLKKFKKDYIAQLVDNDPGGSSYQAAIKGIVNIPGRQAYIPSEPYFIHFITTPAYDRLTLIYNHGDQKRIISFRKRLTHTQYNKIIEQWHGIAAKPKPEIAHLFWRSLDIKEVNKEFYKQIKERFDALVGIATTNKTKATDSQIKQFAVRLIGRYIFCWFLKEKGIIPEGLLSHDTITGTKHFYKTILLKLFFETLNTKVQDRELLPEMFQKIPYLNGGLFDENDEDRLFRDLDADDWLKPFVQVLENYDFTVDESSSNYQHVAVDPEMLGRIFENLLASQNPETEKAVKDNERKAYGAFYTPREIVDYMVNESLKAYLQTSWEEQAKPEEKTKIDKSLTALFSAQANADGLKKEDKNLLLTLLSKIKILDPACGSGAFPMGVLQKLMELHEALGTVKSSYELKKDILSQNIYGVDIMPMAIEIARLRAWLSLVLEEDYKQTDAKHNYGLKPLPNLDFKFVCANSLIDLGLDEVLKNDTMGLYKRYYEMLKDLEEMRVRFFLPDIAHVEKETLKQQYLEQRDKVVIAIEADRNDHLKKIADKIKVWDPFDDSTPSPFFSPTWMFGVDKGFDIVIGNPPYKQVSKGIYSDITFPYSEGKDKGKQNLYKVFVEASYNLIRSNGVASMIVQSSLLCDLSATFTRELLLTLTKMNIVIEYPKSAKNKEDQVFESVLQGTCTYLFKKSTPTNNSQLGISIDNDSATILNINFEMINQCSLLKLYPETKYIPLIKTGDSKVLEKINIGSIPFSNAIKFISQGDLNLTSNSNEFSSKKTKIKLYRGRNIHKYQLLETTEEYVNEDFLKDKVDENQIHTFIVLQEITGTTDKYRLHACLTNKNEMFLFGHTANKIQLKDDGLLEFYLGLLNSKLIDWLFRKTSTNNHVMGYELKQLPVPRDKNISPVFRNTVKKIIDAKEKSYDTTSLEKKIDIMVYHLYHLTYEEAKIIDPELEEGEYLSEL